MEGGLHSLSSARMPLLPALVYVLLHHPCWVLWRDTCCLNDTLHVLLYCC